jgi:hypothetical protein
MIVLNLKKCLDISAKKVFEIGGSLSGAAED